MIQYSHVMGLPPHFEMLLILLGEVIVTPSGARRLFNDDGDGPFGDDGGGPFGIDRLLQHTEARDCAYKLIARLEDELADKLQEQVSAPSECLGCFRP